MIYIHMFSHFLDKTSGSLAPSVPEPSALQHHQSQRREDRANDLEAQQEPPGTK